MSKFDVSDFDVDELNKGVDVTNFPNSPHSSLPKSDNHTKDEDFKCTKTVSVPVDIKPNRFAMSLSDDVFDGPGAPKTPRTSTTPG